MPRTPQGHKRAFLFFFLLSFVLMISPVTEFVHSARIVVSYILFPTVEIGAASLSRLRNVPENVASLLRTAQKNRELNARIREAEMVLAENKALAAENRRLSGLLGVTPLARFHGVWARVVMKNADNPYSAFFAEKPEGARIKPSFPVASVSGGRAVFVGRVLEVYPRFVKILPVTDKNSSYICSAGIGGGDVLARGKGGRLLEIKFNSADVALGEDDEIYTSPSSLIAPPGLYVGRVSVVGKSNEFLSSYRAEVEAGFNPGKIREVYIISAKSAVPPAEARK